MSSQTILNALSKNTSGNLSQEAVRSVVTWGQGPEIIIVEDPGGLSVSHGYYDNRDNQIQLDIADIEKLEAALSGSGTDKEKLQSLTLTYMTLLHETVHYGDYLDGLRQDGGEPGLDFEMSVWTEEINIDGEMISRYRFFPDKYEDTQSLIDAINQYLNSNEPGMIPTLPANEKNED